MDRSVKRDIQKRYRNLLERYGGESDEVFCYVCDQCGQVTKVRQIVKGMAPGGIECPYCHGQAMMDIFDAYPNITATYEWYRPELDEVLRMVENDKLYTVNFILSGGLIRRVCSKN